MNNTDIGPEARPFGNHFTSYKALFTEPGETLRALIKIPVMVMI